MKSNSNQSGSYQANDGSNPSGNSFPGQYYQQQFAQQHFQQPQQQPQLYPNSPMMFGSGAQFPQGGGMPSPMMNFNPPSEAAGMNPSFFQQQQQHHQQAGQPNSPYGAGAGGQFFMDAACTIPAGQLRQQPQLLSQMPASALQPQQLPAMASPVCNNPNCKHCSSSTSSSNKPGSARR